MGTRARWSARLTTEPGLMTSAAGIEVPMRLTRDPDRRVTLELSPADAAYLAGSLLRAAERVERAIRPAWEATQGKQEISYYPDRWSGPEMTGDRQ